MTTNNGANLLIDCLIQQEVEYIFTIPGAKIDAIYDVLLEKGPKVILCRHEQNAAFMAAAYGRLTGKPGVVLVTSGPGVSNLVTGLLTATTEGDPIVALGGAVPRSMSLKETHQSADNVTLMRPVTKSSVEVICPNNLPEALANAFIVAQTPRSGSTFVSLPQDVMLLETNEGPIDKVCRASYGPAQKKDIDVAVKLINEAVSPLLFVGLEASRPANAAALNQLLQKTKIPVVGSFQSAGSVSEEQFDCYVSRVGLFQNSPGDVALDHADVVIACGFDPVEYDPEIWNKNRDKKIININYSQNDVHLTYHPEVELMGDIAVNLSALSDLVELRQPTKEHAELRSLRDELVNEVVHAKNKSKDLMHPLRFIHDINNIIDKDTTILCDVGTHYMWLARYLFSFRAHQILFSNGQQTLGVALPWAMAASMLYKNSKVLSVSGDGGFLFSAMELETAVREGCDFVHCIWRDGSYNMVKQQQLIKYKRESHVALGRIDIPSFAHSFGAKGFILEDPDQFPALLEQAFSLRGPVLIDIPIDYSDNHRLFELTNANVGN